MFLPFFALNPFFLENYELENFFLSHWPVNVIIVKTKCLKYAIHFVIVYLAGMGVKGGGGLSDPP